MTTNGSFGRDDFEPGFVLISKLFAWCHLHYFFYFAFWAALQIGFLYYGLKDRKFLLPWVGLNIMLGLYFMCWMNLIRQYVVVCAFVPMTLLILQRKAIPYVVCVALLYTIHHSALMLLPLYLFAYVKVDIKDSKVLIIIFLSCIILGVKPLWLSLFENFNNVLNVIGYEKYSKHLHEMIESGGDIVRWGPCRISVLIVDSICIWYYSEVKKHFSADKMLPLYFTLAFVGICMENILINTNGIVLRSVQFMLVFVLILSAYTIEYFRQSKKWLPFGALCLCSFTYSYIVILKAVFVPSKILSASLYDFFFLE